MTDRTLARARLRWPTADELLAIACLALAVLFLSPATRRTFFYASSQPIAAQWPWFVAIGFAVARWLFGDSERRAPILLAVCQLALVFGFASFTHGEIVTRDDHPSFLYRFHLLQEHFPRLVFYNPDWNGGYLATEIVSTGALAPFLLALPLAPFASAARLYAWAIPYLAFGVVPWALFAGLRAAGVSRTGAALAGILALAPTGVIFLYLLTYGVLPFVVSSAFATVVALVLAGPFLDRDARAPAVGALVASTTVCCLWPLGALMLVPVVPALAIAAPRLDRSGWGRVALAGTVLAILNLPWLSAYLRDAESLRFALDQRSSLAEVGLEWTGVGGAIVRVLEETHPLALLLSPAGLAAALASRGGIRRAMLLVAALALWSFAVVVFGPQVKERIALERFAVPFAFALAGLAASALDRLFAREPSAARTLLASVFVGTLLFGVFDASAAVRNRGRYRYETMSPDLVAVLATIRDRCPTERRLLVPGYSVHWFGGGHMAPLPFLTERSVVGNDFYHRFDRRDAVPERYRSPAGIGEFADLFSVGCILTWEPEWAARVAASPRVELLDRRGGLAVWTVANSSGPFLGGSGRIRELPDGIVVETTDDDVTVKYRWVEGLTTEPPVTLEPFEVDDGIRFIRIRTGGARRIVVRR